MAKSELIARQSAHRRGLLGHIVARLMALDTAAANRRVLAAIEAKPGDRILELGYGHGRALRRVADKIGHGGVTGVDPSQVMCDVATRHNRRAIKAGTVLVKRGSVASIPASDATFDKAFSVHTIYFWPDLDAGLRELHRVLRPGGQLWLSFHSSENSAVAANLPESVYSLRSGDEIVGALERAGFHDIELTIESSSQMRLTSARA